MRAPANSIASTAGSSASHRFETCGCGVSPLRIKKVLPHRHFMRRFWMACLHLGKARYDGKSNAECKIVDDPYTLERKLWDKLDPSA